MVSDIETLRNPKPVSAPTIEELAARVEMLEKMSPRMTATEYIHLNKIRNRWETLHAQKGAAFDNLRALYQIFYVVIRTFVELISDILAHLRQA
jgi:hypothetical protein